MEEEKAAAYYDELTRKGEGAAKFKQGLGFSSSSTPSNNTNDVPERGSALLSTSSSFLSSFVKASSTTPSNDSQVQKQAQLESIQSKLKKKPSKSTELSSRVSNDRSSRDISRDNERYSRRHSRSRDDDRSRYRERRRSRSRDRYRKRERRKSRSRSRSFSDEERRGKSRSRRRSLSPRPPPRDQRSQKSVAKEGKDKKSGFDYTKLIDGYDKMMKECKSTFICPERIIEAIDDLKTPAERVKAKMKVQLSETAKSDDATNGMGSGWERFNFDKEAPLDDEEIEVGDDDKELVKHIGQSFRLSAVEARREERIKATHDDAMFGTPSFPPVVDTDSEEDEEDRNKNKAESATEAVPVPSLISEQVRAMQQGSWRDRAAARKS